MERDGTIHHQSKHHAPSTGPQRPEWLLQEVSSPPVLPVPGGGRGPFLCCSRNSGPNTLLLFFGLLLCLLSCARPPDCCHLLSVKFSCKVSQCVVPDNQHVTLSGCSQIAFSNFIHMRVSQEGPGSLGGSRCEMER